MFNKSGVFGRNESANSNNRRDPAAGASLTSPVAASPSGERLSVRPVSTVKESVPTSSAVEAAPPVVPAAASDAVATIGGDAMGARLIVGPDVKLKGAEILDCDTLVVEGRVEATMDSRVIRIAENGSFSGKVSIDIAEIHGTFEGELTARSQLIIHSTGRVSGTIRYGKLVADEGGELCGDINVIAANSSSLSNASPSGSAGSAASSTKSPGLVLGVVSA